MATYVLIHGASSTGWDWHRVVPLLTERGHEAIAPDLPVADAGAGFEEYADAVVEAIGDRKDLIVVAHSLGGFTAPLVCERIPVGLLVLVSAMVPTPGETAGEWWAATGFEQARREADIRDGRDPDREFDVHDVFFHDVPPEVVEAALARGEAGQSGTSFERPYPLKAWPDVPTRFLLGRQDRFFPAHFQRRVVRERLGFEPDEMDSGHLPALAHPVELVDRLEAYRTELSLR